MRLKAHERCKAIARVNPQSVAAAASVSSANSIEITRFRELLVVCQIGAFTGGVTSVQFKVEHSDSGTGSWTTVTGGDSGTALATADRIHFGRVRCEGVKQYVRLTITVNGGTSAMVGGCLIGLDAVNEPVSQDFAVAFDVGAPS